MSKIKNFTARNIKGQIALGGYSHQENNQKVYVVVYNDTKYFGLDMEAIFNELEK